MQIINKKVKDLIPYAKNAKKHEQKQIDEIKRMQEALTKTDSKRLKSDYSKRIARLKADLKEYCGYRGFDYREIIEGA